MGGGEALVLLNPRAVRDAESARRRVARALTGAGIAFRFGEADSAEATRRLARQATDEGYTVVGAGGDGTANAVVNGVLSSTAARNRVALLPLGTGNDFTRLRVGRRIDFGETLRALAEGRVARVDVGRVTGGEYFLNVAGVGFDAEVVRRLAGRRPGRGGYFWAVARTITDYRARRYRLGWPGGTWDGPALMVAAMNGTSEGGGFRLAPAADARDGSADVCKIDPIGLGLFARYVIAVRRGTHTGLPVFHGWRTARLEVESEEPIQYHIDGEYRELDAGARLDIEIEPARLGLCV